MHIDLETQFEILPVSFLCMDTASILHKQMGNYFKDQRDRKPEKITMAQSSEVQNKIKSKTAYMKTYKCICKIEEKIKHSEIKNE